MWWNIFHEADDALFDAVIEGLPRPPSLLLGRHYSLDADARCNELVAAGFADVSHSLFSRAVEMTPASLRALFATFSSVRQLAPIERARRLDMAADRARRELGERFERTLRTSLYWATSPGREA